MNAFDGGLHLFLLTKIWYWLCIERPYLRHSYGKETWSCLNPQWRANWGNVYVWWEFGYWVELSCFKVCFFGEPWGVPCILKHFRYPLVFIFYVSWTTNLWINLAQSYHTCTVYQRNTNIIFHCTLSFYSMVAVRNIDSSYTWEKKDRERRRRVLNKGNWKSNADHDLLIWCTLSTR